MDSCRKGIFYVCDKLNGCIFIYKQSPPYPYHANCRCKIKKINKPIPYINARAYCDIRKFSDYIFNPNYNNGKMANFERRGYTKSDREQLKSEFERQALLKYCNGEYKYKGIGKEYAKIEIIIELPNKDSGKKFIKTEWSLKPNGEITLTTPYSGHI